MSEPCPRDWEQCHRSYCQFKQKCAKDAACEPAERAPAGDVAGPVRDAVDAAMSSPVEPNKKEPQ